MIEAFQYINKAFESKVRLGIMAILMVNEEADFNFLKEQLSLTDGNLASHTRSLEELGYIVKIQMSNRRSNLWDVSTVSPKQSRLSSSDY